LHKEPAIGAHQREIVGCAQAFEVVGAKVERLGRGGCSPLLTNGRPRRVEPDHLVGEPLGEVGRKRLERLLGLGDRVAVQRLTAADLGPERIGNIDDGAAAGEHREAPEFGGEHAS
jgi:hypothetical protein